MSARWTSPAASGFSRPRRYLAYKRISIQPIPICLKKVDAYVSGVAGFRPTAARGRTGCFGWMTVPARMMDVDAGFAGGGTSAGLDEA
jgi:hypothetical protein